MVMGSGIIKPLPSIWMVPAVSTVLPVLTVVPPKAALFFTSTAPALIVVIPAKVLVA